MLPRRTAKSSCCVCVCVQPAVGEPQPWHPQSHYVSRCHFLWTHSTLCSLHSVRIFLSYFFPPPTPLLRPPPPNQFFSVSLYMHIICVCVSLCRCMYILACMCSLCLSLFESLCLSSIVSVSLPAVRCCRLTLNHPPRGRNSSLVVFGLAVHSVAGSILWGNFLVEGIFPWS